MNINTKNKTECCGCSACADICPRDCISIKQDCEGFFYPHADDDTCVQCGKCLAVCPVSNSSDISNGSLLKAYAARTKDRIILKGSSSGGLFIPLAKRILSEEGSVFGASFTNEWSVHHICTDSTDLLKSITGSKYVESYMAGTYREVVYRLSSGKKVLFTGTPCQINAVINFITVSNCDTENLYTASLLCMGIPSSHIWSIYIDQITKKYKKHIASISFKDKSDGWSSPNMRISFTDGSFYKKSLFEDPYGGLFSRAAILRPICYQCPFKSIKRRADITMGDYWGISQNHPELDDDLGFSLVLAHSQKGLSLISAIEKDLELFSTDAASAMHFNTQNPPRKHRHRKKIFSMAHNGMPLEKIFNKYRSPISVKRVIAIVSNTLDPSGKLLSNLTRCYRWFRNLI